MINFTGQTEKFPKTIKFFNKKLSSINFSKLKSIHLSISKTFGGMCYYPASPTGPTKRSKFYRITCSLNRSQSYPEDLEYYIRYEFTKKGDMTIVSTKVDKEKVRNDEELMVWLLGHELFHFLRHTRQIEGKNTQSQANEYGFACLREFKRA